jgi:hypothetical protein
MRSALPGVGMYDAKQTRTSLYYHIKVSLFGNVCFPKMVWPSDLMLG